MCVFNSAVFLILYLFKCSYVYIGDWKREFLVL